jgi:hypothetical protein
MDLCAQEALMVIPFLRAMMLIPGSRMLASELSRKHVT